MKRKRQFDEIGYWSELKLEILQNYAVAYSTILAAQKHPPLHHAYIDAFAGSGVHISKRTGEFVKGSPLNALAVKPPFRAYHLIDIDSERIGILMKFVGMRQDVHLYEGDCNEILLEKVFPLVQYNEYRRGLCILDPYGLHLEWEVIQAAGRMKSIDLFVNFPVADMNRNVLWRSPEKVEDLQAARMDSYWGDASWRDIAYSTERNLFGLPEKEPNEVVAEAFRQRLVRVAGFERVAHPLPMRNSKGAIIYYLFFASQKGTAEHVVTDIFNRYRARGGN
jgi:three-Cys-motif partner protein